MKRNTLLHLAMFLAATPGLIASAQTYDLNWFTVAGGGGSSTGALYSLSGTVGQPDAGAPMTGGSFSVTGGFWSLLSVVQTPGAPWLTILNTGTNAVKVCWPDPSASWVLQQNGDLTTTNWASSALSPAIEGTNRCVTLSLPAGKLFFRLFKP